MNGEPAKNGSIRFDRTISLEAVVQMLLLMVAGLGFFFSLESDIRVIHNQMQQYEQVQAKQAQAIDLLTTNQQTVMQNQAAMKQLLEDHEKFFEDTVNKQRGK